MNEELMILTKCKNHVMTCNEETDQMLLTFRPSSRKFINALTITDTKISSRTRAISKTLKIAIRKV